MYSVLLGQVLLFQNAPSSQSKRSANEFPSTKVVVCDSRVGRSMTLEALCGYAPYHPPLGTDGADRQVEADKNNNLYTPCGARL